MNKIAYHMLLYFISKFIDINDKPESYELYPLKEIIERRQRLGFFSPHKLDGMNPSISTTIDYDYGHKRRSGRTSRQINFAIDQLFKGKRVYCIDHYCHENPIREHYTLNRDLLNRVIKRIAFEHPNNPIRTNSTKCWIELDTRTKIRP